MPLTEIFNKVFAKVILQLIALGSAGYGLWLLNPWAKDRSVIQSALSAGGLEMATGILIFFAALWFIIAVQKEKLRQMRVTSMTMMILWLFFLGIYVSTNPFVAVVPLCVMFVLLFGYVFIKSPKHGGHRV